MAIEDIERLKEKVNSDPNSKLFILLAEEYKNAGMLDEAVNVLTGGIEKQPEYMSARVSLGKIYLERGMLDEAKAEFEKVVHTIPENLYAHKKLAEIYTALGKSDSAVEEFKEVLKLNPLDEWALTNLADREEGYQFEPEAQTMEKVEEKPAIGIEGEKPSEIFISEQDMDAAGKTQSAPLLSLADADAYILQGNYIAAIDIYKELLLIEPYNMQMMQRIEELKALLKLLGGDKEALITRLDSLKNSDDSEALIARLNSLLNGIKKRRDDFFGNP
jgi:tetratricopeptide (TPR) repeat protein